MTSVAGFGLQISAQAAENTAPWSPSREKRKYSVHWPRRPIALGKARKMEGPPEPNPEVGLTLQKEGHRSSSLCDLGAGQ